MKTLLQRLFGVDKIFKQQCLTNAFLEELVRLKKISINNDSKDFCSKTKV